MLAASEVKYRAQGIFNEYRQDSNFFYLTGKFAWQTGDAAEDTR